MVAEAMNILRDREKVRSGDKLVIVSNIVLKDQLVDTVQMRFVE